MPTASMEELKGKISAGEYSIDPSEIAAEILTKHALVRKVRRMLISEDEERAPGAAGRASRSRRRARSESPNLPKPRGERLS